jgi:hypothetical protein
MPASSESPERQSGKLPTGLLWAGVGVAPLAALALLVGSGDRSLRAAIGLALLAVVLIGLAIVLRPSSDSVKAELEDTIYDEIDVVRDEVRNDITTAARATHRALAERIQQLQATVDQLRGQVESVRGAVPMPSPHSPRPGTVTGSVPAGVVRHTETVQVTTRQTIVDPHVDEAPHGGRAAPAAPWADAPAAPATPSARAGGRRRAPEEDTPWPPPSRHEWTPPPSQHQWTPPSRHEWTPSEPVPSLDEHPSYEDSPRDRWSRQAMLDQSGPSAGLRDAEPVDRWAALRNDDHGSELRMGERRASLRSDENGSELRIEDRWAAIRRDEPRAGRHDAMSWDGDRWEEQPGRRALPASNDEPSASDWMREWPPREQEPRRRRYADDY